MILLMIHVSSWIFKPISPRLNTQFVVLCRWQITGLPKLSCSNNYNKWLSRCKLIISNTRWRYGIWIWIWIRIRLLRLPFINYCLIRWECWCTTQVAPNDPKANVNAHLEVYQKSLSTQFLTKMPKLNNLHGKSLSKMDLRYSRELLTQKGYIG